MTSSINVSKREPRKPFSVEILRGHQDYYFFEVGLSFACNYWGAYGFRYYRRLSDGQKMAHMIKISWFSLTVEISTPKNEKFIFFRSRYSLLNYADAYVFLFFVFESHDREIDQQTNLPIDSEVTTVNFLRKHIVMHIIRKLLMYWTQKYNFYSKTMYKKKVITFFSFWWWKWLFFTVTCKSGHVIYYFKGNNVLFANIVVLINQFSLGTIQTRK